MVCTGSTTWRDSAMTNFTLLSLGRFCQQRSEPRYLHSKLSTNPAYRLFTRAWVLDPMTARQRAPWRRHAVHMRARRRNAFQRSITPALTSDTAAPTSRCPIRSNDSPTDCLCYEARCGVPTLIEWPE